MAALVGWDCSGLTAAPPPICCRASVFCCNGARWAMCCWGWWEWLQESARMHAIREFLQQKSGQLQFADCSCPSAAARTENGMRPLTVASSSRRGGCSTLAAAHWRQCAPLALNICWQKSFNMPSLASSCTLPPTHLPSDCPVKRCEVKGSRGARSTSADWPAVALCCFRAAAGEPHAKPILLFHLFHSAAGRGGH